MHRRRHIKGIAPSDLFEHRVLLEYVDNLRRHARTLGVKGGAVKDALLAVLAEPTGRAHDSGDVFEVDGSDLTFSEATRRFCEEMAQARSAKEPPPSVLERHVEALARYFGLDHDTTALLGAIVRIRHIENVADIWSAVVRNGGVSVKPRCLAAVAAMAGVPMPCVERALLGDGVLIKSGLCSVDSDGDIIIPEAINRLIATRADPPADPTDVLVGRVQTADLAWEAFSHLGLHRDLLARILGSACEGRAAGVHVVLHGPPGTGKTEFAKTLAQKLCLPLVALGEVDEDGDEPDRNERMAALRRAARVLGRGERRALLMVDEAEDVLGIASAFEFLGLRLPREAGSKVYLHRLIESFPVPVIWVVNDLERVPDTVIRRMSYVLEMQRPGIEVRRRVWSRALAASGLPATEHDVDRLAREYDVAPAVAVSSARAAALAGGGLTEARAVAMSLMQALKGESALRPVRPDAGDFRPVLVNTDRQALQALERMAPDGRGPLPFSLCLYGPPGTGKSACARYLAGRMGLSVVQKRASDLLGMYVGESEKRIAAAFREARGEGAVLIFDEADSLLRSRELSRTSWEVSQVNEMLTWMESHPLPFVCTTNLLDALDPASLRRFTFKLRLDYLTPAQARLAFAHFFGRAAPTELDGIGLLTPSDFALAHKRAELGGFVQDDGMVLGLLRDESRLKPDHRRPMGFQAA
ncbi:MAG: ATP-binding protein [Pseudomonadota bacterium]